MNLNLFGVAENELINLLECYYEDCPLRLIAIGRPMVSYMFLLNCHQYKEAKEIFLPKQMRKNKEQVMELNRETAIRLWNKSFGKDTKVTDFAGRTMAKGAYNDRKSEFGWNVDHILPQSKGGVTADYNLICCHIKTNDEKANTFPCFNANGKSFEIIKVQNHYEIRERNKQNPTSIKKESSEPDFLDSASGIRFFKKLKGTQNKKRFVGTIFIKLFGLTNTAVVEFIEELMSAEDLIFRQERSSELMVVARNCNMPSQDDSSALLDKCVILNTYLSAYFEPGGYIEGYEIYYREDCFTDRISMYEELTSINYRNMNYDRVTMLKYGLNYGFQSYRNSLFVNDLVLINTEAGKKVAQTDSEYTEYNYVYTQLAKNLEKEVKG